MATWPTHGAPSWDAGLKTWMDVSHNSDGTLKTAPVQTALGGSVPSTGDVVFSSDTGATGTGDIIFKTNGGGEIGRATNAGGLLWGNDHNATYYAGTGAPPTYTIPIRFQHVFGRTAGNVLGTTQVFALWGVYGQPTTNDSAEAASVGIILKDAYVSTFTQGLPTVAFEADALAQGVTITNKLIAFTAGLKVQAGVAHNSNVTTGIQYYAAQATIDASQVLGDLISYYAESPIVNGTLTNAARSFYGKEPVQSEKTGVFGLAGNPSANQLASRLIVIGQNASTGQPVARITKGSGSTDDIFNVCDSGNNPVLLINQAGQAILKAGGTAHTMGSAVGPVFALGNVTTAPTGNYTAGGHLYASAGALVWRGSSGTVTTVAPA